MEQIIYYGESNCQSKYKSGKKKGQQCDNKAYYMINKLETTKFLCGMHSKCKDRHKLPRNPKAIEIKRNHINKILEAAKIGAQENKKKGIKGQLKVGKLRMRQPVDYIDGFINVYPNFKHKNRKDSILNGEYVDLHTLSPMYLGPVHEDKSLPPAQNLENWWQGSKVFEREVMDDLSIDPSFYKQRLKMFADTKPHRRRPDMQKGDKTTFALHNGDTRYTYVPSRKFYCSVYSKLAKQQDAFKKIPELLADGYNVQIMGYDGRDIAANKDAIYEAYKDPNYPFGHELVLFALYVLDEKKLPWK